MRHHLGSPDPSIVKSYQSFKFRHVRNGEVAGRDDDVIERLRRHDDVANEVSDDDFEDVVVGVELDVLHRLPELDGVLDGASSVAATWKSNKLLLRTLTYVRPAKPGPRKLGLGSLGPQSLGTRRLGLGRNHQDPGK